MIHKHCLYSSINDSNLANLPNSLTYQTAYRIVEKAGNDLQCKQRSLRRFCRVVLVRYAGMYSSQAVVRPQVLGPFATNQAHGAVYR